MKGKYSNFRRGKRHESNISNQKCIDINSQYFRNNNSECYNNKVYNCKIKVNTQNAAEIVSVFEYCTSWNFRGGLIFANFASQTLAKIFTSIYVYL